MRKHLLAILLVCLAVSAFASALEKQPLSDYRARREALAQKAGDGVVLMFAATEGADAAESRSGFMQDQDFYYLTGWANPGAAILIAPAMAATETAPARAYTEVIFLPVRNPLQEQWLGYQLGPDDPSAAQITGFARVESLDKLHPVLAEVTKGVTRLAVLTDTAERSAARAPLQYLRRANAFPYYVNMTDVRRLVGELRQIKDPREITLIRKATEASIEAHLAAMRTVRPGITAREVDATMQYEFMRRGCERPAYAPIVATGKNSTVLHYSASEGTLKAGDVIKMDVGGEYSGYATDITRTLPVNGKFTPRQRELYEIVLGAHQAAVNAFRLGVSHLGRSGPGSLHQVAYDYINTHGKGPNGEPLGKYFPHGLSHHVGLDVHDPGTGAQPLKPGMVFTIEPGIYIPEEGIGFRIEDMFLVGDDGRLINLSERLPRTVEDIERTMSRR